MLTINCTPAAVTLNDRTGERRRNGVDFAKLPITGEFQWVNVNREVRLNAGRLEVRQYSATDCYGPRTTSYPLFSRSAPLSHAAMIAGFLGNAS
jgi:hypothetical protein